MSRCGPVRGQRQFPRSRPAQRSAPHALQKERTHLNRLTRAENRGVRAGRARLGQLARRGFFDSPVTQLRRRMLRRSPPLIDYRALCFKLSPAVRSHVHQPFQVEHLRADRTSPAPRKRKTSKVSTPPSTSSAFRMFDPRRGDISFEASDGSAGNLERACRPSRLERLKILRCQRGLGVGSSHSTGSG